jgi:hypothetical protein
VLFLIQVSQSEQYFAITIYSRKAQMS